MENRDNSFGARFGASNGGPKRLATLHGVVQDAQDAACGEARHQSFAKLFDDGQPMYSAPEKLINDYWDEFSDQLKDDEIPDLEAFKRHILQFGEEIVGKMADDLYNKKFSNEPRSHFNRHYQLEEWREEQPGWNQNPAECKFVGEFQNLKAASLFAANPNQFD